MKRSISTVTTGNGTQPSSSTAAHPSDANPESNDRKIHASQPAYNAVQRNSRNGNALNQESSFRLAAETRSPPDRPQIDSRSFDGS
jgi:hypothetical protein